MEYFVTILFLKNIHLQVIKKYFFEEDATAFMSTGYSFKSYLFIYVRVP